jgi:hypothetical protein
MPKLPRISGAVAALTLLAGGSPGMALSGEDNPDIGAIRVGSTRGEVEMHLGSPVRSNAGAGSTRVDIYEYEIGNEPSGGRAVAHGVMDVLTLGIWEIAGTPIEAVQGESYEATITYDEQDRVANIKTRKTGGGM